MKKAIFIMAFYSTVVCGQKPIATSNEQALRKYAQTSQLINRKLYKEAVDRLVLTIQLDSNFADAREQLGDLYRITKEYQKATVQYRKVLALRPAPATEIYFKLAECELGLGEYQNALNNFKRYQASLREAEKENRLISKYIKDCEFGLSAMQNPEKSQPTILGPEVNTENSEYLPSITADANHLIFTRLAHGNEDLFQSLKRDAHWLKATYLSDQLNTYDRNEGTQCISPDGLYLFFTACNRSDGFGRCDIYVSRREGSRWGKPYNLGRPINTSAWESQPSISADGKTLYFVSNRYGSIGGYDIWKSSLKEDGSWTEPINLGPLINTAYNEQSPFIHPDNNTLYFSSNGWPGLGDKDIFMSRKDSCGNWQQPKNLGYPINTPAEESGLVVNATGDTAYFSSNRPGGYGAMDIYSLSLPIKNRPIHATYLKGLIVDEETQEPLGAQVSLTDLSTGQKTYEEWCDLATGQFLITLSMSKAYALAIERGGYMFYNLQLFLDTAAKPIVKVFPLERIALGKTGILSHVFFQVNRYDLSPESKHMLYQLIRFMHVNKNIHIQVNGYADSTGQQEANRILSENRAKTICNFLITNGISPSRLSFRGYGAQSPISVNTSEAGRQRNRRASFVITKV